MKCTICETQLRLSPGAGKSLTDGPMIKVKDPMKFLEEMEKPARHVCPDCGAAYCPECLTNMYCPKCNTRVRLG